MTAPLIAPLIPPRARPGGREQGRTARARRLLVAAPPEVPAARGRVRGAVNLGLPASAEAGFYPDMGLSITSYRKHRFANIAG